MTEPRSVWVGCRAVTPPVAQRASGRRGACLPARVLVAPDPRRRRTAPRLPLRRAQPRLRGPCSHPARVALVLVPGVRPEEIPRATRPKRSGFSGCSTTRRAKQARRHACGQRERRTHPRLAQIRDAASLWTALGKVGTKRGSRCLAEARHRSTATRCRRKLGTRGRSAAGRHGLRDDVDLHPVVRERDALLGADSSDGRCVRRRLRAPEAA